MEKARLIKLRLLTLFLLVLSASSCSAQANAAGRKVGGRTEVKDVKNNEEVQELGRYCVREYNRLLQEKQEGGAALLSFSEVVEAETQVVSGIKYYLKISAASSGGAPRIYDAVVVVTPWTDSRELLDFAPSPEFDHPASKQFLDMLV